MSGSFALGLNETTQIRGENMSRYEGSDLRFSDEGDLVITSDGDFDLVHKKEFIEQSSRHRMRTSDPDWFDYDVSDIGANLEDLIGWPNNPDTAREGISRIMSCLTKDGLISHDDIYIRPVPIEKYVLVFFIFIDIEQGESPITFNIMFNLETGIVVRSVDHDFTR